VTAAVAEVEYQSYTGVQITAVIGDVAALRISVFREYPYLYDGNRAYEERYLQGLVRNDRSLVVVARVDGAVIAAATALPLASDAEILAGIDGPFAALGLDAHDHYYYSEIVVDPAHRSRGIAREFYRRREAHARALGYRRVCLAAIEREPGAVAVPSGYFDPAAIWAAMGFVREPSLFVTFRWPTRAAEGTRDLEHKLVFWLHRLA
jgi:GNAT superfamily N-acetyltransferase